MENLDNYLKNSSAFARVINAGNGGGNPWHDEKGVFTDGPASSMGLVGNKAEEVYKKEGAPFGKEFSTSSREAKKFQEAHSILQIATDIKLQDCYHYLYKSRNGEMKPSRRAFFSKMSIAGNKVKFLSNKIADLSTQPKSDKNVEEIKQRIKQIDLALERAKKNVEAGDKIYESIVKETRRGKSEFGPDFNGSISAHEAAHTYAGALNTLKYIASSLVEK